MAILQENKQKVCPVIDYHELNEHVNAYTDSADVSAHKSTEWQQQGSNVAVLDLFTNTHWKITVALSNRGNQMD